MAIDKNDEAEPHTEEVTYDHKDAERAGSRSGSVKGMDRAAQMIGDQRVELTDEDVCSFGSCPRCDPMLTNCRTSASDGRLIGSSSRFLSGCR